MHIVLTGLNHKTAPLEVRERVSFPKDRLADALPKLTEEIGQGVILWTCNRTEVYGVSERPESTASAIRRYMAAYNDVDVGAVEPYLYDLTDLEATVHLFRVASGLDSMILGESQILGQVRDALTAASESKSLKVPLSRLFHSAIRTGRRVRDQTEVGRNSLSISYAGVQLAETVVGSLRGLTVLLVGAGEAGQLVSKALRSSGAADLVITNRTPARAKELTKELGGRVVPYEDVSRALADTDVVITATEAPEHVLNRDMVVAAMTERGFRGLLLLDLSVPRNIDPFANSIDGVRLFNIDDLSGIAEENLAGRREAAVAATRIVEQEAASFMRWWDSRESVPVIKDLRERGETIRKRELERALRKLGPLSDEDQSVLNAMTQAIVRKLLHHPTKQLKKHSDDESLRAARDLFQLRDDDP